MEVLDEAIAGIVQQVEGDEVTILTDDGFPMRFMSHDLVKIEGDITVSNFEAAQVKKQKELPKKRTSPVLRPKERSAPKMEVDLHIHQLLYQNVDIICIIRLG